MTTNGYTTFMQNPEEEEEEEEPLLATLLLYIGPLLDSAAE